MHLVVEHARHLQLLLELVVERGELGDGSLEIDALLAQLGLTLRESSRGFPELGRGIDVVRADRVGEVCGAQPVLGVLRLHRRLEHVGGAVTHVQLRRPGLHQGAQLGRPGPERRDLGLGLGDLRLQLGLLGLGGGDAPADLGGLGAGLVEALLRQAHRIASGRTGGRRRRARRGTTSREDADEREGNGDPSKHDVPGVGRCWDRLEPTRL